MTRQEIKALAKEKFAGHKWKIIYPFFLLALISIALGWVAGLVGGLLGKVLGLVVSIVMVGLNGSYMAYILKFTRTGDASFSDIFECFKARWKQIIWSGFLVGLFTFLWSLLLVVPGIIAAFSYAMVGFLVVDTDLKSSDVIAKSKELMNGHKWEYFVFVLSFIGWAMLAPFTLGILYIWLIPYMYVSITLYYDQLKNGGTLTEVDMSEPAEVLEGTVEE